MRYTSFCAALALAIAGAFALSTPVHAWGAFNDVWIETSNASYGAVNYPVRADMFNPPTGGNSIAVSAVSSTALDAFEMQYYFSEEIIEYCSSTYTGSVPKIISGFLNNKNLQSYQNNGIAESSWTAWEHPENFGTWTANFLIDGAPTTTPQTLGLRVVCSTNSAGVAVNEATPPGNSAYTSADFEDVEGTGSMPNWSLELVANLPSTLLIPTSTSETWCNSTSTGGMMGDIYAGIRNGLCSSAMTLFVPSNEATNFVIEKKDSIQYRFPFSSIATISGMFASAMDDANRTTGTIEIVWPTNTSTSGFGNLLPTSTKILDQEIWETWVPGWLRILTYNLQRFAIWYGLGMSIYILAMKLLKGKEE